MPEGKDGAVRLITCQDCVLPVTLVNLYLKQLRAIKNSLKGLRFIRGTSNLLRMLMKCEALECTCHLRNTQVKPIKFWKRRENKFFLKCITKKDINIMFLIFVTIVKQDNFQPCVSFFSSPFMNSKMTARFGCFRERKSGGR